MDTLPHITGQYFFYNFFRIFIGKRSTTLHLSSPLLLRNSPTTFAIIPLSAMSLSSLNRSNFKPFRHIMPHSAPVCEGMHYHKTGVPWHINNTFIIFMLLLISPEFLIKCLILQGLGAVPKTSVFKVFSQIIPYFLIFVPAKLVNTLENERPYQQAFSAIRYSMQFFFGIVKIHMGVGVQGYAYVCIHEGCQSTKL